ncbi:MAG: [FeFe] hydrogenase H-cluster maturation GTPase HydF [Frisingicoccus sp.]|uniref:[FeFe] hydrogenase H-cluster maturation GTPase HydF n=1 Tax=Frisingicoccus sp. TaxID=1918627 RepID=UPI002A7F8136|nr:[FeFe] hydrogenase H-cluster maturation GTPase HydF [Frisingicoccus sp.]MDY4834116.1 [FeFe] hydrogenase H-cluster maturation GTPase HydF [Frisingicoccus sp.]
MGMNQTPASERIHIGFFGKRNAGKSSVVNKVTGQTVAIVSPVKGTTTDPVYKTMELLPMGPVMIIDTPGIDDEGRLGELRVKKTYQVLNKTDVAVLVVDGTVGITNVDQEMIRMFKEKDIPYIVVFNKKDLCEQCSNMEGVLSIWVSAEKGDGIHELKEKIAALSRQEESEKRIVGDMILPGDFVVLVVPVDSAAPKGRLILPQQQTIRDILDAGGITVVVKDSELKDALDGLGRKPKMVITDSQAFDKVSKITPEDIMLTSFSILFARYKGSLESTVKGAAGLNKLKDGDKVLISEGCTHHRQCEDIGTVKIPRWIERYTGKKLVYEWSSGTEFPEDLSDYSLVVHCGGCMLNEREMKYRQKQAGRQGIPMTNYGILIACTQGILKRSLMPFPEILRFLSE